MMYFPKKTNSLWTTRSFLFVILAVILLQADCQPANSDLNEELLTPEPECPEDMPDSFVDSCAGYSEGQSCNYGHMYMGCTWDTLSCSPTAWCSCDNESETWACAIADIAGCDASAPEELPWGYSCDPDKELPTPPPEPECPEDMPDSLEDSCAGYLEGQRCNYGHTYLGCTWDTLSCSRTAWCSCDNESESWVCTMVRIAGCDASAPEELPWGDSCDPDKELPTPPPEPECPEDMPDSFVDSCARYSGGQSCSYDHMYMGCTWDTLSCSPIAWCSCDDKSETWACTMQRRTSIFECDASAPEGLPRGNSCDPEEELPTPPAPECPEDMPDSFVDSCAGYPERQRCNYQHIYMGCTWDTLRCGRTAGCSCDKASEIWMCAMASIASCDAVSVPEGLPWGEVCDPDEELPVLSLPETSSPEEPEETKADFRCLLSICEDDELVLQDPDKVVSYQWNLRVKVCSGLSCETASCSVLEQKLGLLQIDEFDCARHQQELQFTAGCSCAKPTVKPTNGPGTSESDSDVSAAKSFEVTTYNWCLAMIVSVIFAAM